MASTGGLNPGDTVVAVGFPFGMGPSVSAGVVSGLKREFVDPDRKEEGGRLSNLIQFDAAVNPGNSGGPLVNRDGEVVGIVTAIFNPTGQHVFAGMAFAVPIENAAKAVGDNPLIAQKGAGHDMPARMQGLEHLLYEVKKVVVGQDHFLERVLVALLAGGHLLVEGVPGLAKTLTVATLAKAMQGSFKRIQFTPDLVPADLTGTRIFNQKNGEFITMLGPVFANLVLADEINRAPAKVQSALLEVMQERQVTIAGESLSRAQALCGDGDPESDRDRRHLCPAGSAGRPLHDEGPDRLSQRGGGIRHCPARDRRAGRGRRR